MKNKEKGITLIALTVTVVVLLILLSISVGTLTGKKGIINGARETVANAERESIIQKINADIYNEKVKTGKAPDKQQLIEIINQNYGTVNGDSFISNQGEYTIQLAEIQGWASYVQNGLVLHLDAINNVGEGDASHSNTTTVWKDLSGNGNDATLYNGPIWNSNNLYLDGLNDYATIEDDETMKPIEQTIEIVFDRTAPSSSPSDERGILFVRWHGYTLELDPVNSDGKFVTAYGRSLGGYLKSPNTFSLNNLYHIGVTHKNNISKLYMNLNFEGQQNVTPMEYSVMNNTSIGYYNNGRYVNGKIYAIRMYNRALSEMELENNYNIDRVRFEF